MDHKKYFALCEVFSESQCSSCSQCWTDGNVCCFCGTCVIPTEKTRMPTKNDMLSPSCFVMKKRPHRGAQQSQKIFEKKLRNRDNWVDGRNVLTFGTSLRAKSKDSRTTVSWFPTHRMSLSTGSWTVKQSPSPAEFPISTEAIPRTSPRTTVEVAYVVRFTLFFCSMVRLTIFVDFFKVGRQLESQTLQ